MVTPKTSWKWVVVIVHIFLWQASCETYATIIAGAGDQVLKWNGSSWVTMSGSGLGGIVCDLCYYNGALHAGTSGGHVYKYMGGSVWQEIGQQGNPVLTTYEVGALAVHNGLLYAGQGVGMQETPGCDKLYVYDSGNDRWLVAGTLAPGAYESQGVASLYDWNGGLFVGDTVYDIIWQGFTREQDLGGSCIWDFQPFTLGGDTRLYACAWAGKVYVRKLPTDGGDLWQLAATLGSTSIREMETYYDGVETNLYCAYGSVVERLRLSSSSWNALQFEQVGNALNGDIRAMLSFGSLYCGTEQGNVYSYSTGSTFTQIGSSLGSCVRCLAPEQFSPYVFDFRKTVIDGDGLNATWVNGEWTYGMVEYEIIFDVSTGSPAGLVVIDELPEEVTLEETPTADPPATISVNDGVVQCDFESAAGRRKGVIRIKVRPDSNLQLGHEIVNKVTLEINDSFIAGALTCEVQHSHSRGSRAIR